MIEWIHALNLEHKPNTTVVINKIFGLKGDEPNPRGWGRLFEEYGDRLLDGHKRFINVWYS